MVNTNKLEIVFNQWLRKYIRTRYGRNVPINPNVLFISPGKRKIRNNNNNRLRLRRSNEPSAKRRKV